MKKFELKNSIYFLILFLLFSTNNSDARISIIRDAEIEKFLYDLTKPILKSANLNSDNIKIYIVNDSSINAFVTGGQNIFINTGLITKFKTPDALIGVIAHEVGHIASGHLARSSENFKEAENAVLLSYLLGLGAIAGGSPDVGSAIIMGGSQTAQRVYMKYSRSQEESADSLAIQYLDKISYPAFGLIDLLEYFESQNIGYKNYVDEYLLSHPVSRNRIELIKSRTKDKKFSNHKINNKLQKRMNIIVAKLEGFLNDPDQILQTYSKSSDFQSRYIRSIANYKKGNFSQAINLIKSLIKENDKDGFIYELYGQILFEGGYADLAILAYQQAIKILPKEDSALSKINLAFTILSKKENNSDELDYCILLLKEAKKIEKENPFLFKNLAIIFMKKDDEARYNLALSEYNYLLGDYKKALKHAKEAKKRLPDSATIEITEADDLIDLLKDKKNSN